MSTVLLLLSVILINLYLFMVAYRQKLLLAPDTLFVFFNLIALLGTVTIVDTRVPLEEKYLYVVAGGVGVFGLTALGLRLSTKHKVNRLLHRPMATPISVPLVGLYITSLAISVAYYVTIGQVTLIQALVPTSSGGVYDVSTSRLANYSGEAYLYPGYVNQFKNSLLPILTAAIIHTLWVQRLAFRLPISMGMSVVAVVMLAGTGQRGALVVAVLTVLVALGMAQMLRWRTASAIAAVGVALFGLLTFALQRQAPEIAAATSPVDRLGIFVQGIWDRVVIVNPASGLAAFNVTEAEGVVWGRQWVREVSYLLPGSGGESLANRVFEYLYGTPRGTAPESVWGGLYYNFGLVAGVIVIMLMAIVLFLLGSRLLGSRQSTGEAEYFLTVLALSGMTLSIGTWIAGTPATIVNSGFIAYSALYLFSNRATRMGPSEA